MRNFGICCAAMVTSLVGIGGVDAAHAHGAADKGKSEMQSLHEEIGLMRDREAIRELPITYCYYVHQKDVNAIVSLFTKDGKLNLDEGLGGTTEGTEALRAFYKKSIDDATPWPFVHNHHIVLIDRNTAKGSIYAEIRYGSQGFRTVVIGVYEDEYEKVDGTWRFKSRVFKSHNVVN